MIYLLYILLVLLGIVVILFLPVLLCIHIVKTLPHSKLGKWIRRHIVTFEDLEPSKEYDPQSTIDTTDSK